MSNTNLTLSLFQLQQEFIELTNILIENEGELTPELEVMLQLNKESIQAKGVSYAYVVKQLGYEVDMIKAEEERLKALRTSREKSIERLKETLKTAMENLGIEEIKGDTIKINFRKSQAVQIDNPAFIPIEYINIAKAPIMKKEIGDALKAGLTVNGARLVDNKNIQIK